MFNKALCAFPGLKGAPMAWEEHSAKELAKMDLDRSKYDGCLFMRREDHTKAGRHADDFMCTGPAAKLDVLLVDLAEKLKLRDVIANLTHSLTGVSKNNKTNICGKL